MPQLLNTVQPPTPHPLLVCMKWIVFQENFDLTAEAFFFLQIGH